MARGGVHGRRIRGFPVGEEDPDRWGPPVGGCSGARVAWRAGLARWAGWAIRPGSVRRGRLGPVRPRLAGPVRFLFFLFFSFSFLFSFIAFAFKLQIDSNKFQKICKIIFKYDLTFGTIIPFK